METRISITPLSAMIVKSSGHSCHHIIHSCNHRAWFSPTSRRSYVLGIFLTCQKIAEGSHELNNSRVHLLVRNRPVWPFLSAACTSCNHCLASTILMTRSNHEYDKQWFDGYPRSWYHHNILPWSSYIKVNDLNDKGMYSRYHVSIPWIYNHYKTAITGASCLFCLGDVWWMI